VLEKTRGIFLHAVKYSETSLIATVYTEDYGRQSLIINGIHGKHSMVKASAFQPMYLLELEIYHQERREIQRLKHARMISPYLTIQFDIRKSSQAFFLAEILYKCLREEEPNAQLFQFISNSMAFLDVTDDGVSNFHLWFLLKLTRFLGIVPNTYDSPMGNFFDLQSASFVVNEPAHNQFADRSATVLLSKLFDIELASLKNLDYTPNERKIVLESLIEYYRIHVHNFGEIKSLTVLKSVFQ
jgi:DNA repair protein RecO (recombination protein O)